MFPIGCLRIIGQVVRLFYCSNDIFKFLCKASMNNIVKVDKISFIHVVYALLLYRKILVRVVLLYDCRYRQEKEAKKLHRGIKEEKEAVTI